MTDRVIDPNVAVDAIRDTAPVFAKAKAERVYLEEFRKSKKAILMRASMEPTLGAQESYAYSHPEYLELLTAIKEAVEAEELHRWRMVAAQARVEVWRSLESSKRTEYRVTI